MGGSSTLGSSCSRNEPDSASTRSPSIGSRTATLGGFNGTDPAPTLAQFERYVASGKIHYFIASEGGSPGTGGTGTTAAQITAWVEAHFRRSRSTA
jgi:hypothetical protein